MREKYFILPERIDDVLVTIRNDTARFLRIGLFMIVENNAVNAMHRMLLEDYAQATNTTLTVFDVDDAGFLRLQGSQVVAEGG